MDYLEELNPQQREAVEIEGGPVLVIAGAGSGKTKTLATRVAHLIQKGVAPGSILLLTFTRRAAEEMVRRAQSVLIRSQAGDPKIAAQFGKVWGGTFHATANRLLRTYATAIKMSPDFTVLDEADSQNLMDMARRNLGLNAKKERFPQKGTLLAVYSRVTNTGRGAAALEETVKRYFPWVAAQIPELDGVFRRYIDLKNERNLLDYDDLLIFWLELLRDEKIAAMLEKRFEHVLVDEYQDTNPLQAQILKGMRQRNHNIMVVGDDAQSIYAFRAATVRNILDFPNEFPGTRIVTLTQNYRSVGPILDATNRVIAYAKERFTKDLWSERTSEQKPLLVTCFDENEQTGYVIEQILKHYEEKIPLRRQAVLFRAGQLSNNLELELVQRNIPYHKYGGLRYLEAAHVKDLLSYLRSLENPKDDLAWFRMLNLLPGVGQGTAANVYEEFASSGYSYEKLPAIDVPPRAKDLYAELSTLLANLAARKSSPVAEEVRSFRGFYGKLLPDLYENAQVRDRDLDHLELVSQKYRSRQKFLTDLALDPPSSTSDLAGKPSRDEDWLVLSTMHSAKGLEFDVVYIIHTTDGFIPSDLSTGSEEEIEEERRLLYVAMTRARNLLYCVFPLRYYSRPYGYSDRHGYAQLTRFIPPELFSYFERLSLARNVIDEEVEGDWRDLGRRVRDRWWGGGD